MSTRVPRGQVQTPIPGARHSCAVEFQERSYAAEWYVGTPTGPSTLALVDRMLDSAVRAPNAGFTQGWAFLVLDTQADVPPLMCGASL